MAEPKCIWTRRRDIDTREITLTPEFQAHSRKVFVCPEHEPDLRQFYAYVRKWTGVFMGLLLLALLAMAVSSAFGTALGVGLGVIMMGILLLLFPFTTPQTVWLVGVRNSIWIARLIGAAIVILGIWQIGTPLR